MKEIAQQAKEQLVEVEKFFVSYYIAGNFFQTEQLMAMASRSGLPHQSRPAFVKILAHAPTGYEKEEIPGISINPDEAKFYMMQEGSSKIFKFSIQLMYESFEHCFRESFLSVKPNAKRNDLYFNRANAEKIGLNIPQSIYEDLVRIREARNCYTHNRGVWDEAAAKKLSKALNGELDTSYPLQIGSASGDHLTTNVGEKIQTSLNQADNIMWMKDVFMKFYDYLESA